MPANLTTARMLHGDIYKVIRIASAICGKVKKYLVANPYRKDIALDFRQGIIQPLQGR